MSNEKDKAQVQMDAIKSIFTPDRTPGFVAQKRFFSVLTPLIRVDGEWHVLFETRSSNVEQPGEICFPGGAMEEGETAAECAVREACEEIIGLEPSDIEIIGPGDTMVSGPGRGVFSYIGIIHRDFGELKPSPAEVQEIFTIPLSYFLHTEPIIHGAELIEFTQDDFPYEAVHYPKEANWSVGWYDIVFYDYEKDPPLWGMTAGFMRRFADILKENGFEG